MLFLHESLQFLSSTSYRIKAFGAADSHIEKDSWNNYYGKAQGCSATWFNPPLSKLVKTFGEGALFCTLLIVIIEKLRRHFFRLSNSYHSKVIKLNSFITFTKITSIMKRSISGLRNWAKKKCEEIPLQFHTSCGMRVIAVHELVCTDLIVPSLRHPENEILLMSQLNFKGSNMSLTGTVVKTQSVFFSSLKYTQRSMGGFPAGLFSYQWARKGRITISMKHTLMLYRIRTQNETNTVCPVTH